LKYQPLAREISSCYGQPVEIIPIVFGHTGVVSCHFQQLQQATLLGTLSILRDINFRFGVT